MASLTIYLIKDGWPSDKILKHELPSHTLDIGHGVKAELFIQPGKPKPPRWASFFTGQVGKGEFGKVSSSSAVLVAPVRDRSAALSFGQGRHLLAPDCWEDRFGLRVVLNSIDENRIRSIDKDTFEAIARHVREQASRGATTQEFGFDIERDLLRAVTGTPKDERFGRRLTGMDALHTDVDVELQGVSDLLDDYYRKSRSNEYKKAFQWVDQIAHVTNQELLKVLDDRLVKLVQGREFDRCWLAVPEIVDWARVRGFRYSGSPRRAMYHDIHLEKFLEHVDDPDHLDSDRLRNRRVFCFEEDDRLLENWSVYRCLNSELDHKGSSYLLSGGKWYSVVKDFVQRVNNEFAQIPRYDGVFSDYTDTDESEGYYNERIVRESKGRFALMDRKNIPIGGGYNKVEFCDVFTNEKDIIHIKRYGGSSVLSHLFSQGTISGESFVSDEGFRARVNNLLPESHRLADSRDRPRYQEYRVVFAIVSQSPKPLGIPFFSRVSARHAAQRLAAYGYRVALAKISVTEAARKLERYGEPRTRRR
jgi:uncharacterized protein (TIGR04141 family)